VLVPFSPLTGKPGSPVIRTIAIREDQTLDQLHEALRIAFGWGDPHLYSFWISGKFWDDTGEYTSPVDKDEALEPKDTADVPIGKLGLRKGRSIAYVFDFGDEWRVLLKVVDRWEAGDESYPMLGKAGGEPPPQYTESDEEHEEE